MKYFRFYSQAKKPDWFQAHPTIHEVGGTWYTGGYAIKQGQYVSLDGSVLKISDLEPRIKHHRYTTHECLPNWITNTDMFTQLPNGLLFGSWIIELGSWIVVEDGIFCNYSAEEHNNQFPTLKYEVTRNYPEWITQAIRQGDLIQTSEGNLKIVKTGEIVGYGDVLTKYQDKIRRE